MVGRKLDQGILVKIVLEDTEIRAVHHVKVRTSSETQCAGGTKAECTENQVCCQAAESAASDHAVGKVAFEVPEIGTQEVLGEWLIPTGESLLVSFGAYTIADTEGKAVVRERLAIVEAADVRNSCAVATSNTASTAVQVPPIAVPRLAPVLGFTATAEALELKPPVVMSNATSGAVQVAPVAVPRIVPQLRFTAPAQAEVLEFKMPMAVPVIPSRSIPQGVHADGRPAELPALPDDEMDEDSSESESAEPRPSPQSKKPHPPKPASDAEATKTSYSQKKSSTVFLPSLFLATPSVGFQFLLPLKPLSLKLPFGQRLEIEIFGRIVPDSQSR